MLQNSIISFCKAAAIIAVLIAATTTGKKALACEAGSAIRIMELIISVDDADQRVFFDNSRVEINTAGIRRVTAHGPKVIPTLIRIMRDDQISFDAFVRCYSAADQVIRSACPDERVYWSGNCRLVTQRLGVHRIAPSTLQDTADFRSSVVASIETIYERMRTKTVQRQGTK